MNSEGKKSTIQLMNLPNSSTSYYSVKSRADIVMDKLTRRDPTWGKLEKLYNMGKSQKEIQQRKVIFKNDSFEDI